MARKITSIILKSIVALSVTVGVIIHVVADSRALLFFTTQSNIWIGVACLVGLALMIFKLPIKKWMYSVKLIFTVSITLTGVVYCTMLAPFLGSEAYTFSSTLLHVVVPVVSVADFFLYDFSTEYKKWECLTATIPPIYYLVFAGIGYALNWDFGYGGQTYPYFFLNWGSPAGAFGFSDQSPYIGVFYYVVILSAFVIGIAALYILLAKLLCRKNSK
ncbi:MAG: Pr6Pr family membrane protein [Clostridiales bacterium]|nr:Pr6Pr family membrane protein [Clostridiales bacterium]